MSLLRRSGSSPEAQLEKQQKADLRAVRLKRTREARAATRMMEQPEHKYGIYVSVFLVAIAVYSYLSTDATEVSKTVKGKSQIVYTNVVHPEQAIVLFVFAAGAAGTIYFRQRMVTGLAYIVTAFFAFETPVPKSASDLTYVLFLGPVGYATWLLMFKMNKAQKEWLSKHYPAPAGAAAGARNSSRRSGRDASAAPETSRRGSRTPANRSRPAPGGSGRYTPPRPKTRAAQRKA